VSCPVAPRAAQGSPRAQKTVMLRPGASRPSRGGLLDTIRGAGAESDRRHSPQEALR